jgi:hypothetical protein
LESETTKSFATTVPSVGGRTSATPQRSRHD